jgi:hypothetical protein
VPGPNAGTITVAAAGNGALATLDPLLPDASYYGSLEYIRTDKSTPWSSGATLTVTASGNPSAVHSFTGQLMAGGPMAGVSPAFKLTADPPGPTVVDQTKDFAISWTPDGNASGALVELEMIFYPYGGTITCWAPDTAGQFTVPAALFTPAVSAPPRPAPPPPGSNGGGGSSCVDGPGVGSTSGGTSCDAGLPATSNEIMLTLGRVVTSPKVTDNAVIYLEGWNYAYYGWGAVKPTP